MSVRGEFSVTAAIVAVGCALSPPARLQLPADVASFVERRSICDHLRGEEPYNAERRAELIAGTENFCLGTDRELAALRLKYRGNAGAIAALKDFEETIEARK